MARNQAGSRAVVHSPRVARRPAVRPAVRNLAGVRNWAGAVDRAAVRNPAVDCRRAAVQTPAMHTRRIPAAGSRAGIRGSRPAACSPNRAAVVVVHGFHPVPQRGNVNHLTAGLRAARSVLAMAELKSRLRADLTDAMKTKDKLRTATLRMLLAAVQTEEVSGKQARELSDDEVLKVLARESRKRGEAAEIYAQNGRGELAANEHAEARVIDEYLPVPLTEAELADVVDTAMAQVAEQLGERPSMKQMGLVMKAATAIAAGKADGARLSAAVKARL